MDPKGYWNYIVTQSVLSNSGSPGSATCVPRRNKKPTPGAARSRASPPLRFYSEKKSLIATLPASLMVFPLFRC